MKSDGSILALELAAYSQGNWDFNGADSVYCCTFAQSAYNIPSAAITPYGVRTHTAKPSAMRAPGNVNQHAVMETIMEHVAAQTGLSPHEVRLRNLIKQGDPVMPPDTTLGRKYFSSFIIIKSDFALSSRGQSSTQTDPGFEGQRRL